MKKIERLRLEALESCNFRGHDMEKFNHRYNLTNHVVSTCKKCGMGVMLILNPMPNEINISGRAVALNCNM